MRNVWSLAWSLNGLSMSLCATLMLQLTACNGLQSLGLQPSSPAPAVAVESFDAAILTAATGLLSKAQLPEGNSLHVVVIDPLIDGMTGEQSNASRAMGERIAREIREHYPQFTVQAFTRDAVAKSPLVLIGTLTPVSREGKTEGTREAYRICLALANLRDGKIIGKGVARSQLTGVDATPTAYFRDSPAWAQEPQVEGYIKTCQGTKAGDAMNAVYLDRILIGALTSEAIDAYNAGRYQEALARYSEAQRLPGGADQLRILNGLYLSNSRLRRLDATAEAFSRIVDYGLANRRLAIKLLFKPGSTAFLSDASAGGVYDMWLQRIAERSATANACLEVDGHTSPTGPEPLNERLSQLRAETIRQRLIANAPALAKRSIAVGMGSRENLIGTGRDDASDALDRRAVFKVIGC